MMYLDSRLGYGSFLWCPVRSSPYLPAFVFDSPPQRMLPSGRPALCEVMAYNVHLMSLLGINNNLRHSAR